MTEEASIAELSIDDPTKHLPSDVQQRIAETIGDLYFDSDAYNKLLADKLPTIVTELSKLVINHKTLKKVMKRYLNPAFLQNEEEKRLLADAKLIIKATYVLIISFFDQSKALVWPTVETLLEAYPQFRDVDAREQALLLRFRNILRVSLQLLPAERNKKNIMSIAGRLEGARQEYITGGGQKKEVVRRVQIYEQEGKVVPQKRPERRAHSLKAAGLEPIKKHGIESTTSSNPPTYDSILRGNQFSDTDNDDDSDENHYSHIKSSKKNNSHRYTSSSSSLNTTELHEAMKNIQSMNHTTHALYDAYQTSSQGKATIGRKLNTQKTGQKQKKSIGATKTEKYSTGSSVQHIPSNGTHSFNSVAVDSILSPESTTEQSIRQMMANIEVNRKVDASNESMSNRLTLHTNLIPDGSDMFGPMNTVPDTNWDATGAVKRNGKKMKKHKNAPQEKYARAVNRPIADDVLRLSPTNVGQKRTFSVASITDAESVTKHPTLHQTTDAAILESIRTGKKQEHNMYDDIASTLHKSSDSLASLGAVDTNSVSTSSSIHSSCDNNIILAAEMMLHLSGNRAEHV